MATNLSATVIDLKTLLTDCHLVNAQYVLDVYTFGLKGAHAAMIGLAAIDNLLVGTGKWWKFITAYTEAIRILQVLLDLLEMEYQKGTFGVVQVGQTEGGISEDDANDGDDGTEADTEDSSDQEQEGEEVVELDSNFQVQKWLSSMPSHDAEMTEDLESAREEVVMTEE